MALASSRITAKVGACKLFGSSPTARMMAQLRELVLEAMYGVEWTEHLFVLGVRLIGGRAPRRGQVRGDPGNVDEAEE